MATIKHIVKCTLPTKDFKKSELQEITITQETKPGDVNPTFIGKIPTYLYDELVDTDKKYRSFATMQKDKKERAEQHINDFNLTRPDEYMKKTFSDCLITSIVSRIEELTSVAILKNTKEELNKVKKLFIRFNHSSNVERSDYNHAHQGKNTKSSFQFFIGYKVEERVDIFSDEMRTKYYTYMVHNPFGTASKRTHTNNEEGDKFIELFKGSKLETIENTYNIIDWTEEAEDFLKKTQDHFEVLYGKLYEFLGDIDNDKIKTLIEENPLKLLNS